MAYCIFDEFKEIKRFLNNRPDIYNICKYIIEPVKFKHYLSNYKRIDDVLKFDFFGNMYKEFKNDYENNNLDKTYWKEDKWQSVQQLINNKKKFFYKQFEITQNKDICWNGLFSIIDKYKNIYIYGAGNVAISLIRKLHQKPYNISGLIVSDMKNNPDNIMNIPVRVFDDKIVNKENDIILIAMKEEYQYDILYRLQEDGYKNIVVITKILSKTLN